jgi:hypothetical protein
MWTRASARRRARQEEGRVSSPCWVGVVLLESRLALHDPVQHIRRSVLLLKLVLVLQATNTSGARTGWSAVCGVSSSSRESGLNELPNSRCRPSGGRWLRAPAHTDLSPRATVGLTRSQSSWRTRLRGGSDVGGQLDGRELIRLLPSISHPHCRSSPSRFSLSLDMVSVDLLAPLGKPSHPS